MSCPKTKHAACVLVQLPLHAHEQGLFPTKFAPNLLDEELVLRRASRELPRGHAEGAVGGRFSLFVLRLVLEDLGVRQIVVHGRLRAGGVGAGRKGERRSPEVS